jgi:hypothetical protein
MLLIDSKQEIDGVLCLTSEEAIWLANDLLRSAEECEDHGTYEIDVMSTGTPEFNSKIRVRPKRRGRRTDENLQQ